MKQKLLWFAPLAALFFAGAASAQTGVIEGEFVGCLTDAHYDAYTFSIMAKNWSDRDQLMASICYELEGLEYSVFKKTFMSARIDVTIDGEAIRLSTTRDAIK